MNCEDPAPGTEAGECKSKSTRNGRQPYRALLKQNRDLLQHCSSLREEVALLKEELRLANQLVDYDPLTELANRRLLHERFTQAAILGKRHQQKLALLFLDLDDFKHINDQLGHVTGDRLLQQVAKRLTGCIRASDTACRFGGDEFVVLLTEINDRAGVLAAVNTVLTHLSAPYVIDGTSIQLAVSSGVAIHPDDGVEYTELVRHSDRSMYRNKGFKALRRRARTATVKVRA